MQIYCLSADNYDLDNNLTRSLFIFRQFRNEFLLRNYEIISIKKIFILLFYHSSVICHALIKRKRKFRFEEMVGKGHYQMLFDAGKYFEP